MELNETPKFKVGDFIVSKGMQVVEITALVERGVVAWLVYPARSHQHLIEWDHLNKNYRPLLPNERVLGGYVRSQYYKDSFWNEPTRYDQIAMQKVKTIIDGD